jgi:DNA-binding SARP family transcriptional activator
MIPNDDGAQAPHRDAAVGLVIRLLGEFGLTFRGRQVTDVDSARQQALIAYLLLHVEAPQSRQRLAFLFWPDSSETQARTNLRNLLHTLMRDLPEGERYIASDGQTVQWRRDAPWECDVAAFRAALQEAGAATDPAACLAAFRRGIDTYRGELVPGCYDDWAVEERERLAQEYGDALERLIQMLEEAGNCRDAIAYGQRLVRHDPLREGTYRQLFRLYWACGDRSGIKKTYRDCEVRLRAELDVEPSPETRRAYEMYVRNGLPGSHGTGQGTGEPGGRQDPGLEPHWLRAPRNGEQGPVVSAPTASPAYPVAAPGATGYEVAEARQPSSHFRLRWPGTEQARGRAARNALFAANVALPVAALGTLVYVADASLAVAAAVSALLYAGLYFVFNPRSPGQQAQGENVAGARDRLNAALAQVAAARARAAALAPGEARSQALRTCDLADRVIARLASEAQPDLPAAARMERIAGAAADMIGRYLQIERGELHAPPERLAEAQAGIAALFGQLEEALTQMARNLDAAKMTEVEVTIDVLRHTLRVEGLG